MQQPISAYHPANHSMATVSGAQQKKNVRIPVYENEIGFYQFFFFNIVNCCTKVVACQPGDYSLHLCVMRCLADTHLDDHHSSAGH